MASTAPKYYRPFYPSDSEESDLSADDSDAESELAEETKDLPDFVSFANGLFRAAGPPFKKETELTFSQNILDRRTVYGPMIEGQEGYEVDTRIVQVDNVIVLQSLDRDKLVYPQPVNCQLMLPRTYVNVTRFEIADISFIASFFYFRSDKYNISLQFKESGRVTFSNVLLNPPIVSPELYLTLTVREGTYAIDTLLEELTIQFNIPPLFYDFINGYSDFYNKFINEGDYSINFNYPGDYYYDAVSRVYIANPTMNQIVSYYFQQRYALPTTANNTFTDLQTKISYYYPVLKEFLLDAKYSSEELLYNGAVLSPSIQTTLLYSFTGIDDPIMADIVVNPVNIAILDAYRLEHTFRYYPVNKYVCKYSTQTNYVCIQSTTLNTSLSSLLNTTYSNFLNTQIQRAGISLADFTSASTQITAYKSILSDMYNILQANLAYIFGVDYGEFADIYFLTFSNVILLKNGLYASNVLYDYNSRISPFIACNIQNTFRQSNTNYWQYMYNISLSNQAYSNTILDANSGLSVYNIYTLASQREHPFQDTNGNIYINPIQYASDIVIRISPGAYTIIPIQSRIRQTAQIEVLPRPSIFLYPEWNSANRDIIGTNQYTFSNGAYTYDFPTGVDANGLGSNIAFPLTPPLSNLGIALTTVETAYSDRPVTLSLQGTPTGMYFTFTTPTAAIAGIAYKYRMGLSLFPGSNAIPDGDLPPTDLAGNTFADTMTVFMYHDQAAFYADIGSNGESPFFYKYRTVIPAGATVQTIEFHAYEGQKYYVYCRATNPLSYSPITFTLVPFVSSTPPSTLYCNVNFDPRLPSFNPYIVMRSNFFVAKVHDPDYIRLPIIDSNGYYYKTSQLSSNIGFLPSASNSPATASINILLKKPIIPLGYSSGVSDNLTDYIPIVNTFPPRAFDPLNQYQFRFTPDISSYDPVTQTYDIGIVGAFSNALLNPNGSIYGGVNTLSHREKQIVQYTGTHYIATESNVFTTKSSNLRPLTSASIPGLVSPFETRGACGLMFMPEEGTWSVQRLTFLSQSSNTNVHFLAIYPTAGVAGITLKNISLSNAISICVLKNSATYYDTPALTGVPYGTYYTYASVLSPQSNYVVSGKLQSTFAFVTDTNSYFSAIAYSFSNPATLSNTSFVLNDFLASSVTDIENLTGTCIPYPDLGIRVAASFYDGTPTPDTYTLVLSSNRPLKNINDTRAINPNLNPNFLYSNYYTSQYALSSPIVNSHLHFKQSEYTLSDFSTYTNFFLQWYSVPDIPTDICTSVYGTLLFQTSELPIASYLTDEESTEFDLKTILSMDILFPPNELTIPLAQSGTSNSYIFLGCTSSNLVFKEYSLSTGNILTYPAISTTFIPQSNKVQGFIVQGTRWWLCYLDSSNAMNIAYGSTFTDPYIQMSNPFIGPYTSAQISLDVVDGTNMYFAVSSSTDTTFSTIYSYALVDLVPPTNVLGNYAFYSVHPTTKNFSIQYLIDTEYIYQLRTSNTYIYRMNTRTSSNVISAQNLGHQPTRCIAGPEKAIWILFDTEPYIMAYVFTVQSIHIAWQQMFPVMKIELVEIAEKRLPIPDTYNLTTPEWGHSLAFGYSNLASLNKDLYYTQPSQGQSGALQWGKESYFQVSDTSFQGFYFNAYLGDVPLQTSNTSYVALRGFSPTESFQAEVRISLPNVYDLGYVSLNDMINEIATLNTVPTQYSVPYRQQLSTFDGSFVRSGIDALYGISSFSVPTTGFSNFLEQYSTLYGKYASLKTNVDIINASLRTSMQTFIQNDMKYILPANILTRTRFTDSLTFSFLWKTALQSTPPTYANLVDGWGLGWNLGFPKEDDVDPSTVHFAPSMYKIIEDFLYLRLNPEFNLNRMSAGTKENYLDSREPSGLTSYYYCKLLLNGYGQTATTFVHSPIILNPPIPKISKISFQWIDARGNLLNIPSATDSDWQMTVNIQENVQVTNFVQTSKVSAKTFLTPTKE
jgi:hypothetical protein